MRAHRNQLNCEQCPGREKSIFCDLEGSALQELNSSKNANLYKKGQNLFIEGNPPFGLYCIHNGKVKVTKTNAEGKETIVRLARDGDIIGHRSLFSSSPYEATATVIEEGLICFVSKDTIQNLIQESPKLSFKIIHRISSEMGAAENKLASMARKSVRERFAETLLVLKENFGSKTQKGIKIDIKLTREELGSMIGAASENIIRLITEYKDAGYLFQEGKTIYIKDLKAIENEASIDI